MMITRKHLLLAVLASCLLTMFLIAIVPIRSGTPGVHDYDPWSDVNNDGGIDGGDLSEVAARFGTAGQPIEKAGLLYDSGWIDITGKRGQDIVVTDNLNVTDWNNQNIEVDITGRTTLIGAIIRPLGLTGQQEWNKTYAGAFIEGADSVTWSPDYGGCYMLAGYSGANAKDLDFWIARLDPTGSMVWNKTYGGTGFDVASSAIEASIFWCIVGRTSSFGAVKSDAWLMGLNPGDGAMVWNKTYGGTGDDMAYSLTEELGAGLTFAGWSDSWSAGGDYDAWLVNTDTFGTLLWNKTYGGALDDRAYSVIPTHNGGPGNGFFNGYAFAGCSNSFSAGGAYDFWLVKTDMSGNMVWNKTYGGTGDDRALSLVQTGDGGYAIAGVTESFGVDGDFWLVKTDANGNKQWSQTFGGTGYDEANSVIQTGDGGYALAGSSRSFSAGGDYDFWLVKTDSFGIPQWGKIYGGTDDDLQTSLIQTPDGGYALAGTTYSFSSNPQAWLIKTDASGNQGECGLTMVGCAPNTMTLYRGKDDPLWNYVRVQIWQRK